MGLLIYLDGKMLPESEAKVSVFDHGLLYGDGVFEGIRAYHGLVFKLDEHVRRLYRSAATILLKIPIPPEEMALRILETLRANNLRDAYIRVVVTRGKGDLGLDPNKCARATYFIIASRIQLYPPEFYEKGIEIITVPTRRNGVEALNPAIKSLNYLNNILAKIEGLNAGVHEALMLNQEGLVLECTGDNIFLVRGRDLVTPPIYLGVLDGITRQVVLGLADAAGLQPRETPFTRHELFNADEVFMTGTAAEIVAVSKIDGRVIGSGRPGPMTQKLLDRFRELTRKEGTPIHE
ncbi:MAG TPA: branched-chain-amino-acid transaminase [bacterium]|nr:branched-chain-amino-acid transaminase [bacterium]HNS49241.1 branched-chain-amino-acid transaminase [bacterium]